MNRVGAIGAVVKINLVNPIFFLTFVSVKGNNIMTKAELDFYTQVPNILRKIAEELHALNEKLSKTENESTTKNK